MKKNKILSLIAALTLTAGTSLTPIMAENATEDSEAANAVERDSFTITKNYNALNAGTSNTYEDGFAFSITKAGMKDQASTVTAQPDLTYKSLNTGSITTGTPVSIKISTDEIKEIGVYTYTINEVKPENEEAYIDYNVNNDSYTVVVTVTNNGKYIGVKDKDGNKVASGDCSFTNRYKAGSLTVTKKVEGNMGDTEKRFNFTVTGPDTTEVGQPSLADKESKTYKNIPYGTAFSVAETEANLDGYTTKSTVKVGDSNETDGYSGTISAASTTVTFTNTKGSTIDTGIFTDNAPYIAMAGIVAVIAVVFIARRKHAED